MIVEIRNRLDEAVLVRIGRDEKKLRSIGLAGGDAIPVEVPDGPDLTIEVTKTHKDHRCG